HLSGLYFHATVWENVLQRKIKPTPALTPRELQCLEWSARGKTLWEVSKILGISEATSKTNLRGAMRKLDTFNKTHAVSKAVVHGLISV
ncbi:MAG: helix-turn-helix transcriptional regulator, partial [Proteobacteria bacterium]|nr:helix-turn-helix transcriptional regulator [Pseudomonadota bacterium]